MKNRLVVLGVAVLVVSCARLGLEGTGDSGALGDVGDDVADAGDDVADADAELDGDAQAAASGCPHAVAGFSSNVVASPVAGSQLELAAGAAEVGLAWVDQPDGAVAPEVVFLALDPDGSPLSDTVPVSPDDDLASSTPSVAAFDGGFAVAYTDSREAVRSAYLRLIRGTAVGPEARLSDAHLGDEHWDIKTFAGPEGVGVAWHDGHEVYFAAVGAAGSRLGQVVQLTNNPWIRDPLHMTYGAGAFTVVWADTRDDHDVLIGRVTWEGDKLLAPLPVASAPGRSWSPSVSFDGELFIVAWVDDREGHDRLTLARLDVDGVVVSGPYALPVGESPEKARVTWTGADYGLAWLDDGGVYFVSVGPDLRPLAREVLVSDLDASVSAFALAWLGDGYMTVSVEQSPGIGGDGSGLVVRPISCVQ